MEKLEKVLKGFEVCKKLDGSCDDCPYFDPNEEMGENACMRGQLMPDAIELLKKMTSELDVYEKRDTETGKLLCTLTFCGNCGTKIHDEKVCPRCGKLLLRKNNGGDTKWLLNC